MGTKDLDTLRSIVSVIEGTDDRIEDAPPQVVGDMAAATSFPLSCQLLSRETFDR